MTETTTQTPQLQDSAGAKLDAVDEQLAARLVEQARSSGISLVGPDGLLLQLTKLVLEGAPGGELTDHLGWVQLRSRDLMSGRTDDRPGGRVGEGRPARVASRCWIPLRERLATSLVRAGAESA